MAATGRPIDDDASEIVEQRKASLRYFNDNYYGEWVEIYKSMKARVTPKMVRMEDGSEKVDTSRTNVALPDHFVMVRNGVARLTRNPPNLRMRGGNKAAADKAGALLMYQWDRSEAQKAFRNVTRAAKALGWGVGKSYYDTVEITRKLKRYTKDLTREQLMQHEGAPENEVSDAVKSRGSALDQNEQASAIAKHGNVVSLGIPVKQYQGCKLDSVFIGDFYPEPGFRSLNESDFCDEYTMRDEDWLEYWTEQKTTNPETGKEQPVIDEKVAAELVEIAGERNLGDEKDQSLRRQMREAVKITDPSTAGKPLKRRNKRFMVDERHSIIDGKLVIEYVGEDSLWLGCNWYPYDTYGRYLYTEMILIPDILGGIGDSTPRISRFLMQLRNSRANATTDYINNKLSPLLKQLEGENYTDKDIQRTGFGRVLKVRNMNELEALVDPQFPAEAWEDQAFYTREMQQIEPATNTYASGTQATPDSGKLATTAVLQQKSSDNVLADELNQQGQFVREVCELWLGMNQQAMEDDVTINPGDLPRFDAMSLRTDGAQPRQITISKMDIQEDMQVLPEEGSTLADDDEYRTRSLQQGFMLAAANPDVFNKRGIGQKLLQTMPGISIEEGMAPVPTGSTPPPVRVSFSVTAKWTDLAPDVQAAVLNETGLPTHGTEVLGAIHHATESVKKIGEAANAASDLESPANVGGDGSAGGAAGGGSAESAVRAPKGLGGSK